MTFSIEIIYCFLEVEILVFVNMKLFFIAKYLQTNKFVGRLINLLPFLVL